MERDIFIDWPKLVETAVARRKAQGLTQAQLAVLCGISKPTLNAFEQYKTTLSVENALIILQMLGLTQQAN